MIWRVEVIVGDAAVEESEDLEIVYIANWVSTVLVCSCYSCCC